MGQVFNNFRRRTILNSILICSTVIGITFFILNQDKQLTNATILSAILVEVPIQVLIKRYHE